MRTQTTQKRVQFARALRRDILRVFAVVVFVFALLLTGHTPATSAATPTLNFQARLESGSGAIAADGNYNIEFKLYQGGTSSGGGTLKWTEDWLNSASNGVHVANGYLTVNLGSITSFPGTINWDDDLFLGMNVGNTNTSCTPFSSCVPDGEMTPYLKLTSVPHAFQAQSAAQLQVLQSTYTGTLAFGALTSSQSILLPDASGTVCLDASVNNCGYLTGSSASGSYVQLQGTTPGAAQLGNFNINGTGIAATLQGSTSTLTPLLDTPSAGVLNLGTTNATQINLNKNVVVAASQSLTITGGATGTRPASPTEGMLYYDTTTKQLLTYANGKWQADRESNTKIIAPSNASQAAKDAADVVLTGTADQTLINTALTAAAGGKVYIMEGTVMVTGSISVPNNTTLAGAGRGTLITIPSGFNADLNIITNATTGGAGTGVIVRDLRLDGNKANQTSGDMFGVYLNGMGTNAYPNNVQGATLTGLWINSFKGTTSVNNSKNGGGIKLASTVNTTVSNNVIMSNANNGGTTGIFLSSSDTNNFTGNIIQSNSTGVYVDTSSSNTFTGNTIENSGDWGFEIEGTSTSNTITGNNIRDNYYGVVIYGSTSSHTAITGNTFMGTGQTDTFIEAQSPNNTITGNSFQFDSSHAGYGVVLSFTNSNYNTVTGNTFEGAFNAIAIWNGAAYNSVNGNNVYNTSDQSGSQGIILGNNSHHNTVTANNVTDSGGTVNNNAIYITNSDSNTITGNTLVDNDGHTTTNYAINLATSTADTNYLADNTLGGGSINDAGTGTIYGGQLNSSGAYVLQASGGLNLNSATTVSANLTVTNAGNVAFQKGTDYSATGTTNNVNFGTGALFRLTGASAQTITGIAGGTNGRMITLINAAGQAATLKNNDTTDSSAANVIITGTAGDLTLAAGASISLVYDSGANLWRVVGGSSGTSGGTYVSLQGGTPPGTADIGNFNISGTGIAGILQGTTRVTTPLIDALSSGTLSIGTTNATAINIGKTSSNILTTISGMTLVRPTTGNDSSNVFRVQNAAGTNLLVIDSTGSGVVTINGDVGIGTAPAYKLDVAGTANAITLYQNGNQVCDTTGNCNGTNNGGAATNAGQQNFLTKTDANGNLISSQIYDDGTKISIGSTSPGYDLQVDGTIQGTTLYQGANQVCDASGNCGYSGTGTGAGVASINTLAGDLTLQGNSQINVTQSGADTIQFAIQSDTIGDTQLQYDTGQNLTVTSTPTFAALTVTGGATGSRPASPTEGMLYYDTTTKQLLVYANGKWQADRHEAILVAASNSSQTDRDAADYVADGTGDQAEINSALTAASGGKVYLLPGTYTINASISIPNNTTLAGAGDGTLITIPNALNANFIAITNTDTTTGTGLVIRDLRVDGNKANQSGAVAMAGIGLSGVGSSTRAGATVTNVQSNNWYYNTLTFPCYFGDGICLYNSSSSTVTNNKAQGNGSYGIRLSGSNNNNVISGNVVQSNNSGISITTSNNNTVTGNTVQSNSNTGILISSSNYNTITGNTFSSNFYGVIMSTGSNNTVTGNTVQTNTYGIRLNVSSNSNTISDNTLTNNGGSTTNNAIYLSTSDSNNITGNTITDTSATTDNYAINVFDTTSDTNYLAGNSLGGGSINDAGTGTIYGGQLNSSNNYVIQPAGTVELMKSTNVTGDLTVKTTTATDDTLKLSVTTGGSNAFIGIITNNDLTAARTWRLPDESGTICVIGSTSCAASGGFVQFAPGGAQADSSINSSIFINKTGASGNIVQLQSAGTNIFTINNSGDLVVGTATNNVTFASGSSFEPILNGSARHSKTIKLNAEYVGATLDTAADPSCSSANSGTMISGYTAAGVGGLPENYYDWTSTAGTAQCYDVVVQIALPSDFDGWTGTQSVDVYSTNTTNGTLALDIRDVTGALDGTAFGSSLTPASASTWTNKTFSFANTYTYSASAGKTITLRIRMSALSSAHVRIGAITLNYKSHY